MSRLAALTAALLLAGVAVAHAEPGEGRRHRGEDSEPMPHSGDDRGGGRRSHDNGNAAPEFRGRGQESGGGQNGGQGGGPSRTDPAPWVPPQVSAPPPPMIVQSGGGQGRGRDASDWANRDRGDLRGRGGQTGQQVGAPESDRRRDHDNGSRNGYDLGRDGSYTDHRDRHVEDNDRWRDDDRRRDRDRDRWADHDRWTDRGRDSYRAYGYGDRRYDSVRGYNRLPGEGHAFRDRDRGRAWYNPGAYNQYYHARSRYRAAPYRYPYGWFTRTWYYGEYLPNGWFTPTYYLDWRAYGLGYPPIGCEWVRVGDDAILVDVWTGEILSIYYGLFW